MSNINDRMTKLSTSKTPATPHVRLKPVGLTVTLAAEEYRQLKDWPDKVGLPLRLGKARVATNSVMRALVDELLEDEGLQARIAERVAAMGG